MGGIRRRVRGKNNSVVLDCTNNKHTNSSTTQIGDSESCQTTNIHHQLDSLNANSISSSLRKAPVVSWILGKGDKIFGLGKALNPTTDFNLGAYVKGDKISILAFEVAKTVHRGYRLVQSLSDQNIQFFKTKVISSEGVRTLISDDENELLRLIAADKREELESYEREVVRFGNLCKDPSWHSLDRYFDKLGPDRAAQKYLNADAEIEQLMTSVHLTVELLTALCTLDKVRKEYTMSFNGENISTTIQKDLANLIAEIKRQKKVVKSLQKRSLWSRTFEEVVEKLVCVVHFLVLKMNEAFGSADSNIPINDFESKKKKLGPAGLALHYATIIIQIDTIGSLSRQPLPSTRDALYQCLPRTIRSALPNKLQSLQTDLEYNQIRVELNKTLQWLGPIARNTTKALQGFGWSGGWSNFRSEVNREVTNHMDVTRIETLYHADKERTEACILELVMWLHYLIIQARSGNNKLPMLLVKDQEMLENVERNIPKHRVSSSQHFSTSKTRLSKFHRLAKSSRESSTSSHKTKKDYLPRWPSGDTVIDFDIDRVKVLDIIDGLETV